MAHKRIFKTHFYNVKNVLVKVTRSCSIHAAAKHAAMKLVDGTYDAIAAEVMHADTEKLHASLCSWKKQRRLHVQMTLHK